MERKKKREEKKKKREEREIERGTKNLILYQESRLVVILIKTLKNHTYYFILICKGSKL